jgi:hypothetical protein
VKNIKVRKIFKYDPTFNNTYSRYEGYSLITRQEIDPPVENSNIIENLESISSPIYCSNLLRGKQSAKIFAAGLNISKIIDIAELNEVLFDLTQLVSKEEFESEGSTLVRKRFIESFIDNALLESRDAIELRIKNIFRILSDLPENNYLLISHSFFMKLLQIYLNNSNLFEQPTILRQEFDCKKKTFDFGKGFDFRNDYIL